jgi:hypothetical protein
VKEGAMLRTYLPRLTATCNLKGVLDIDTVKGCSLGMSAYPGGGCYQLCYANKIARARGIDFSKSVSRQIENKNEIERIVREHPAQWFRIGCMGDPCHDWDLTVEVCKWLSRIKIPIIVSKHWVKLNEDQLNALKKCNVIINTSTSPLDTSSEREYRLEEFKRIKWFGIKSVLRIVSCKFSSHSFGSEKGEIQDYLFSCKPNIDNPLRIHRNDKRVSDRPGQLFFDIGQNLYNPSGFIEVLRHKDLGGGSFVSIFDKNAYIGKCTECPDQCGVYS